MIISLRWLREEKKNIINFIIIFCFFHLKKLESPSPKDALFQDCLKLAQWFWRREFCYFINIFSPFRNYLPFDRGRALYLNKIESPHPRMLCAKFGWNWLSGSGEDFCILSMYFCYFKITSPWKRAGPFIWTNLNPLHPRMLCAKFGWNWLSSSGAENFLISSMHFRYFVIISPWKRAGPFIWTNLNPLTQGCFVPSLVEIGPVVLGRR